MATQWDASSSVKKASSTTVPFVSTLASSLLTIPSPLAGLPALALFRISILREQGRRDRQPVFRDSLSSGRKEGSPDGRLCLLYLADLVSGSQELGRPPVETRLGHSNLCGR